MLSKINDFYKLNHRELSLPRVLFVQAAMVLYSSHLNFRSALLTQLAILMYHTGTKVARFRSALPKTQLL